jgi:hypothetical protein
VCDSVKNLRACARWCVRAGLRGRQPAVSVNVRL